MLIIGKRFKIAGELPVATPTLLRNTAGAQPSSFMYLRKKDGDSFKIAAAILE